MTEKPVSLNRFRKDKARAEKKVRADENAVIHGMTRAEKDRAKAEAARVARLHEGTRQSDD